MRVWRANAICVGEPTNSSECIYARTHTNSLSILNVTLKKKESSETTPPHSPLPAVEGCETAQFSLSLSLPLSPLGLLYVPGDEVVVHEEETQTYEEEADVHAMAQTHRLVKRCSIRAHSLLLWQRQINNEQYHLVVSSSLLYQSGHPALGNTAILNHTHLNPHYFDARAYMRVYTTHWSVLGHMHDFYNRTTHRIHLWLSLVYHTRNSFQRHPWHALWPLAPFYSKYKSSLWHW